MISVLVVRFVNVCDTRALLRVNTLGRADWDPVHVGL